MFQLRTDLALESREQLEEQDSRMQGVIVEESENEDLNLHTTVVKIISKEGARKLGKPEGTYITMETEKLAEATPAFQQKFGKELAAHLQKLIGEKKNLLVVGLGNRDITPDSLGPRVIQKLHINRHLLEEEGGTETDVSLSGLVPGVMAQTGMETMEIIRGVVQEARPDVVLAVDALAARTMRRVNRTIQITDTGINPGSGVMNNRHGLNKETLGIPVIGIGVPTVVDAAAIVHDAVRPLIADLEEEELKEMLDDILTPSLRCLFVTPKDIDETVQEISETIAEALNAMAYSE